MLIDVVCCFFCNFLQKMARQTIVIESPKELSLREGMIVIADRETAEEILRPLEDIRMIMIDHHSARITVPLINKLASYNVCVVFCDEKHMPVTMTMDLDSNVVQSRHFQSQITASLPLKKQLWKQIVEAKILNQSLLLEKKGKGKNVLTQYYSKVKSGDSTNREAIAAKVYWKQLLGKEFIRDCYGESPNSLLNYGYSLLRSLTARQLMNSGLLPTIGIFHRSCYDSFPLADDIMEPYRPFVDCKVLELIEKGITEVCRQSKKMLLELFYNDIPANAMMMTASTLANVFDGNGKVVVFPKII